MTYISFPIKLLNTDDPASTRGVRAKALRRAREKAGADLALVESFKNGADRCHQAILAWDQRRGDQQSALTGVVILNGVKLRDPMLPSPLAGKLSAELATDTQGKVTACTAEFRANDGKGPTVRSIGYEQYASKEVYTENVDGREARLVLDHAKGILTYFKES